MKPPAVLPTLSAVLCLLLSGTALHARTPDSTWSGTGQDAAFGDLLGSSVAGADLGDNPAFCGVSAYLQALIVDPGAPFGAAFSQGLELQLGY